MESQPFGRDGSDARPAAARVELPLLGYVAAGLPIEAVASNETIAVPEDLVGKRDTYVLRVRGDSMIDEQIRDGDFVVVEDRKTADNGEMVIAPAARIRRHAEEVLPRPRRENPPAAGQRGDAADFRRSRSGPDSGRRRRSDAEATDMPVALVTGASRGVGRGVAIALADAGFTVFGTGRTIDAAQLPLL